MAVLKYQDKDGNVKELDEVTVNYVADEWQPEPDWWDIDKILEEDEEDYEGKIICLLPDSENATLINSFGAKKIKTSDGKVYTNTITHTWDKSKDKECSLGYKTRYVMFYFNNTITVGGFSTLPTKTLYIISKNITTKNNSLPYMYGQFSNLITMKFINCDLGQSNNAGIDIGFLSSGIPLERLFLKNTKVSHKYFSSFRPNLHATEEQMQKIYKILPEDFVITNANWLFNGMRNIVKIPKLKLSENIATDIVSWNRCFSRLLYVKKYRIFRF